MSAIQGLNYFRSQRTSKWVENVTLVLKASSEATVETGTAKISLAIWDKIGYLCQFKFHQLKISKLSFIISILSYSIFQPHFAHHIHLMYLLSSFILCKRIKKIRANTLTHPTSLTHATNLSSTIWITRIIDLIKLHQQLFKAIIQLLDLLSIMQISKAPCNKVHFTLRIKYYY